MSPGLARGPGNQSAGPREPAFQKLVVASSFQPVFVEKVLKQREKKQGGKKKGALLLSCSMTFNEPETRGQNLYLDLPRQRALNFVCTDEKRAWGPGRRCD
ncbi:hypothetical protein Nmel_007094 [Mimus melanotis]